MEWTKMSMVCQLIILFFLQIFDPPKWYQGAGTAIPSVVTNFIEKKNIVGASVGEEAAIADIEYTAYGGKDSDPFPPTTHRG